MRSWVIAWIAGCLLCTTGQAVGQTKAPLLGSKKPREEAKDSTDEFDSPSLVPDIKRKKKADTKPKGRAAPKAKVPGATSRAAKVAAPPAGPPTKKPTGLGATTAQQPAPAKPPLRQQDTNTAPASAMPRDPAAPPPNPQLGMTQTTTQLGSSNRVPLGAIALLGVGGSMLLTGTIAGIRTLQQSAAVEERCQIRCYQADIDRQKPRAHLATAGIVLGLVGIGGGLTWALLDRRAESSDDAGGKDSAIRLRIGPASLQLQGHF